LTYNRDLQEDKEPLFDTADSVRETVRVTTSMLEHIKVNKEVCLKAARDPSLLATDLADYLVRKGLPFRAAHHAVGSLVALAEKLGKSLDHLSLQHLQSVEKKFGADAMEVFDLEKALSRRSLPGAPAPNEVRKQVARWKKILARWDSPPTKG